MFINLFPIGEIARVSLLSAVIVGTLYSLVLRTPDAHTLPALLSGSDPPASLATAARPGASAQLFHRRSLSGYFFDSICRIEEILRRG